MATIAEILESKGENTSRLRDERGRFAPVEPPTREPEPKQPETVPQNQTEEPAQAPAQQASAPTQPDASAAAAPAKEPAQPQQQQGRDPVRGLEAGIAAERSKRQEAERRAAEVEARLSAADAEWKRRFEELERRVSAPTQPTAEPEKPLDVNQFWEAPDKFLQQQFGQYRTNTQQEVSRALIQQAEWFMQQRHDDYQDVRSAFMAKLVADPQLQAQFNGKAPHEVVEWAYSEGKKLLEAEEAKWAERLERKRASATPQPQPQQPPPPSLNAEPSPASPAPAYQGPKPLGALLRNKF